MGTASGFAIITWNNPKHHQGTCYLSIFRGTIFSCNFRSFMVENRGEKTSILFSQRCFVGLGTSTITGHHHDPVVFKEASCQGKIQFTQVVGILNHLWLGYGPFPVTVTTRIIPSLVGNPYKPLFATVTGKGPHPIYGLFTGSIVPSRFLPTKTIYQSNASVCLRESW